MKRIVTDLTLTAVILALFSGCKTEGSAQILDAKGDPVENQAYVELVTQEVLGVLMTTQGISEAQARDKLQNMTAYTAYEPQIAKALENACKLLASDLKTGCAVTDLQGNLIAVYSSDEQKNYANQADSPYSSFKPLSVYMQALEKGKINWSTCYVDSAYKQIEENGQLRDWPANVTNSYTKENTSIFKAISQSVNTVAVKCLAELGVEESISFLKKTMDMLV